MLRRRSIRSKVVGESSSNHPHDEQGHGGMFPSIDNSASVQTPLLKRTSGCLSLNELNTNSVLPVEDQSSGAVDCPETVSTRQSVKQRSKRRPSSFSPALNQTKKEYRRVSTNSFDIREVSNNVCPIIKHEYSKFRKDSIVRDNESVCGEVKPRRKSCIIVSSSTSSLAEPSAQESTETNDNQNLEETPPKDQNNNDESRTNASHNQETRTCCGNSCSGNKLARVRSGIEKQMADSSGQLIPKSVFKIPSSSKAIPNESSEKSIAKAKQVLSKEFGDNHKFISPQAEVSCLLRCSIISNK